MRRCDRPRQLTLMADYNTAEPYKYGFTTDVEMEQFPRGLNEQVITAISEKKNEPQWLY